MPRFGSKSWNNLATCHPDLQTIAMEAIKYFDFSVIFGARGKDKQDAAYDGGYSKAKWPYSKHNVPQIPDKFKGRPSFMWPKESENWLEDPNGYSRAIDIAPYPIDWGNSGTREQRQWAIYRFTQLSGVIFTVTTQLLERSEIEHGIKWGGHFKHWSDMAHYELIKPEIFNSEGWWKLWEQKSL